MEDIGEPSILTMGRDAFATYTTCRPDPHLPKKLHNVISKVYTRPLLKELAGSVIVGLVRAAARIVFLMASVLSFFVEVTEVDTLVQSLPPLPKQLDKSILNGWH